MNYRVPPVVGDVIMCYFPNLRGLYVIVCIRPHGYYVISDQSLVGFTFIAPGWFDDITSVEVIR